MKKSEKNANKLKADAKKLKELWYDAALTLPAEEESVEVKLEGDEKTYNAVYRKNLWYLINSSNGKVELQLIEKPVKAWKR